MELIDKAAVMAEIERLYDEWKWYCSTEAKYRCECYTELLDFLDTLEAKGVDLGTEIKLYKMRNPIIGHREESLYNYMSNVAKHFFELGIAVSK